MPLLPALPARPDFFSLSPQAFDALTVEWGWPKFRAAQVRDWVYKKGVVHPNRMSNLSFADRERLTQALTFGDSEISVHQRSEDGTIKLLLRWPDGSSAETVMIPDGKRFTACVSSQVGCPVGCKFCASGIGGAKGNLSAGQIVEQVIRLNQVMAESDEATKRHSDGADESSSPSPPRRAGTPSLARQITNVVFMGMGEPLANYANVMSAIRILHDTNCMNLGARRMTISTVGVPPKIRELAREELPLNLAISLHAPNEHLRRELIPWAEHFSIEEILSAARYYFDQTGREITLEYILLAGVNDRPEHARQLAQVCQTLRANVNLIRYNEVATLPFGRPTSDDVMTFQSILRHNNVNAHVRKSRGRDIDAACGQLRRKELVQLGS
ncbi:23S rRNA (adenine(2503)-C(2))-methyltransferase RlmN [soil metagenome]